MKNGGKRHEKIAGRVRNSGKKHYGGKNPSPTHRNLSPYNKNGRYHNIITCTISLLPSFIVQPPQW
jgi:hypothetical protein